MNQRFVLPLYALRQKRWPLLQSLWAGARRTLRSPEFRREMQRIIAGTMYWK